MRFALITMFTLVGMLVGLGIFWVVPVIAMFLYVFAAFFFAPIIAFVLYRNLFRTSAVMQPFVIGSHHEQASFPALRLLNSQEETVSDQIGRIQSSDLYDLLDKVPVDGWHLSQFKRLEDDRWQYTFKFNAQEASFDVEGEGATPAEAFEVAKFKMEQILRSWHNVRFTSERFEAHNKAVAPHPKVLIVEDDHDFGEAMSATLRRIGFEPELVSSVGDVHRRIGFGDVDFIFLDWVLENGVTADQVIDKTNRLINIFPDLQSKFALHRPKIVTYSSLEREQIHMPNSRYMQHMDHWHKSISHSEFEKRAQDLMSICAH